MHSHERRERNRDSEAGQWTGAIMDWQYTNERANDSEQTARQAVTIAMLADRLICHDQRRQLVGHAR